MLFLARKHVCYWKSPERLNLGGILYTSFQRGRRCFSRKTEASSSFSNGTGESPCVPVYIKPSDARIIYAVAPAMGHNKVH